MRRLPLGDGRRQLTLLKEVQFEPYLSNIIKVRQYYMVDIVVVQVGRTDTLWREVSLNPYLLGRGKRQNSGWRIAR